MTGERSESAVTDFDSAYAATAPRLVSPQFADMAAKALAAPES
jgi:hypothetical protein